MGRGSHPHLAPPVCHLASPPSAAAHCTVETLIGRSQRHFVIRKEYIRNVYIRKNAHARAHTRRTHVHVAGDLHMLLTSQFCNRLLSVSPRVEVVGLVSSHCLGPETPTEGQELNLFPLLGQSIQQLKCQPHVQAHSKHAHAGTTRNTARDTPCFGQQ